MDKVYSPQDIERRRYAEWEKAGRFAPSGQGAPFCIVIPPPNVTGTLHMGHAFQDTIMDALTRYHRMRGDDTLWQPGTDHAGIATQMVVERQLVAEQQSRVALGRDAFIDRVWRWKEQSGGTIAMQLRRLGASVDWTRDRFTMDPGLSRAVTEVFVRLHEEGLIYRGKRLVNWDPVLQTAVSDLEVVSEEEDGSLWHLRYPLVSSGGTSGPQYLIVATTRPETMLGDSAVAVNPEDERYRALIGQRVRLPLSNREIPIIADAYVDPAFGTGCVKITPAHDFNDYEIGQRHALAQINIFTPDAKLNDAAPARFRGLERFEARRQVIEALDAAGLLERIDKHKLMVPRGDRTGVVLEPYLTDQWYVKIAPLAAPAIEAVETGRTRFVPDNWSKTYFEWMRNIRDWCISRQLWWGHRIPAWYDNDGKVYVGRDEASVRTQHALAASVMLRQDDDVLDTWFSSALWPFSTLGWPDKTPELDKFYPTSVLVTGFDIIFFWVARMLMFGIKFMGDVPFKEVYVHGLVRDHEGQKMSKSKGNVIDPLDIVDGISLDALLKKRTTGLMQPQLAPAIDKATRKQFPEGIAAYGTDALRFTFATLATQSRDIRFDMGRVGGYRNFCNKLWNAARFVMMMVEQAAGTDGAAAKLDAEIAFEFSVADRWIRSRLGETLRAADQGFAEYRLDFVATALYEFTWYEFCDWYLELTKPVLQSETSSAAARRAALQTLLEVLEALLRALHPLMPFITEEIWQRVAPMTRDSNTPLVLGTAPDNISSIVAAAWPNAASYPRDLEAEQVVKWLQSIILGVRQIRGEMDISPAKRMPLLLANVSAQDQRWLDAHGGDLKRLAMLASLECLPQGSAEPQSAMALVGEMRILVPMAGLIDPVAETERLGKRLAKVQSDIGKLDSKLCNESFVRNAPPDVVATDRARAEELRATAGSLTAQLVKVRSLLK